MPLGTGEIVTGTATLHVTIHGVGTSQTAHGSVHESGQLRGETAAGVTYVGTIISFANNNGPADGTPPPTNQVLVFGNPTFHMIRLGEDGTVDDFYAHTILIGHIDAATNTFSLVIEHVRTECQ